MRFIWRGRADQHPVAKSRRATLPAMLIVALATTGCAGIRPYSEVRDKQATAAADAWKDVNLKAEMTAHRENLNALLQAEKAAQDEVGNSVRNFRLRVMVSDKPMNDSLLKPLGQRMLRLHGGTIDQAALDEYRVRHEEAIIQIPRSQAAFKSAGLTAPDCDAFTKPAGWKNGDPLTVPDSVQKEVAAVEDPGVQRELKRFLEDLAAQCAYASLASHVSGSASKDSELGKAWSQYQDDIAWLAADRDKANAAKHDYDVALREYDKAIKRGVSDSTLLQKVKDKLAELQKLTGNPFAEKILSEEKLKSLNDYLTSVTTYEPGKGFPNEASKAARATALLPELADTIRSASASSNKPLVAPYLLMKNHEQLKLHAITRDLNARKQIVAASRAICESISAEVLQLQDARRLLDSNTLVSRQGGKSVQMLLKGGPGISAEDKRQVLEASVLYLDALGRLEPSRYKLEYERIAAFHERTLAYSEVNAQQWENLIGVSLSQLSEYGGGGLKHDEIVGFLNALGIIWIGAGVNK
jgi:hypothetical protein